VLAGAIIMAIMSVAAAFAAGGPDSVRAQKKPATHT